METAPTTFSKTSLDDIIMEFTSKDLPQENMRTEGSEHTKTFKIRYAVRMGNFADQATARDKLEAALRLFKQQDSSMCILPFR